MDRAFWDGIHGTVGIVPVVVKRELANFSIYQSSYVPTLNTVHVLE